MSSMPPTMPVSERQRAARAWPWGLSLWIHAGVLVAGACVVWRVADRAPARPEVVVSFLDPAPAPASAPRPTDGATAPPTQPVDPPPVLAELSTALGAPEAPSIDALLGEAAPLPAEVGVVPDALTLPPEVLGAIAQRAAPEVRFAGLGASNAQTIVYVVDASGSMIGTLPIVLRDLESSVGKLAPTQQFQVVFFGPGGYTPAPHPADPPGRLKTTRLIRATPGNIEAVLAWARTVRPTGKSNPIAALEVALSLRPDVVFVLSNVITGLGVWEPDREQVLARIDALNPKDPRTGARRAAIKSIQFLEDDPAGILRAIADVHGGAGGYRFISRQELTPP